MSSDGSPIKGLPGQASQIRKGRPDRHCGYGLTLPQPRWDAGPGWGRPMKGITVAT
jgi:hypothetical protein